MLMLTTFYSQMIYEQSIKALAIVAEGKQVPWATWVKFC